MQRCYFDFDVGQKILLSFEKNIPANENCRTEAGTNLPFFNVSRVLAQVSTETGKIASSKLHDKLGLGQ